MPTVADAQIAELSAWLAASSRDDVSPKGDTIKGSPYGHLVGITLDDLPPNMTAAMALGCLPLLVASDAPTEALAAGVDPAADRLIVAIPVAAF